MDENGNERGRMLAELRAEACGCRACPLWRDATQTVFGEGPAESRIVLVGEQPGDHEDIDGHPFVGPAGRVLEQALEAADVDPAAVYRTNAVKHFKYRMRGLRRIHQRPSAGEISACRRWLEAELGLLDPDVVVALGGTAAQSLFGRVTRIGENRGRPLQSPLTPTPVLVTVHPSSILRERDSDARHAALAGLVEDLRAAACIGAAR